MNYVIKSDSCFSNLKINISEFINNLEMYCFPNFFEKVEEPLDKYLDNKMSILKSNIDTLLLITKNEDKEDAISKFFSEFNETMDVIKKDIEAFYNGDPACNSQQEIVLAYPTFKAIFIYRFAHILYKNKVKLIPRLMCEYAHKKTGVDINPGASIGYGFFIDHGTGVVIGETSIIGNNVRLYQGVTLGASSLKKGHKLKGTKRHPTIKNNVIIYANSAILGGDTTIGNNVIIGSNCYVTHSINDNCIVKKDSKYSVLKKKD